MLSAVGDSINVAIGLGQLLERPKSSELTNGGTGGSKPALRETLRPVYVHVCVYEGQLQKDQGPATKQSECLSPVTGASTVCVCVPTHVRVHVCVYRGYTLSLAAGMELQQPCQHSSV